MVTQAVYGALFLALLACCAMCIVRIGLGPTAPDRMVAIDILGIVVVGFVALLFAAMDLEYLMSIAIAWALLSFIGTLALAKHLEGREFDE
jgi:multicomponent Na+:H+ antiporter subunit F